MGKGMDSERKKRYLWSFGWVNKLHKTYGTISWFLEQEALLKYFTKQLGVYTDRSLVCHPEIAREGIEFD